MSTIPQMDCRVNPCSPQTQVLFNRSAKLWEARNG